MTNEPVPAPPRCLDHVRPATTLECIELERAELRCLLSLLVTLDDDDLIAVSSSGRRSVRDEVAIAAGAYAAQARLVDAWRQLDPRLIRVFRFPGEPPRASIARAQAGLRSGQSPESLVAELRVAGERALERREFVARSMSKSPVRLPATAAPLAWPRSPWGAVREAWLRRLHVAWATGRPFQVTTAHDGRIVELLLLERQAPIAAAVRNRSIDIRLREIDACWRCGEVDEPAATVTSPVMDVGRLVAGDRSAEATRERSTVIGDVRLATAFLRVLHGAAGG